jgi:hypothetical protein
VSKCKVGKSVVFIYFNLCLSVKLDSLSVESSIMNITHTLNEYVTAPSLQLSGYYLLVIFVYGGNDSPYVLKSHLFLGRFSSRYVEATYDTNDMMLIFLCITIRFIGNCNYSLKSMLVDMGAAMFFFI